MRRARVSRQAHWPSGLIGWMEDYHSIDRLTLKLRPGLV